MTAPAFATVLIASMAIFCASCAAPGEIVSAQYATRKQAEKDGAFARGWLPDEVPDSATDIVEAHNIDSNEIWVSFSYAGEDSRFFTKSCVQSKDIVFPDSRRTKRSAPWWPHNLLSDGPHFGSTGRHEAYACNAMRHAGNEIAASVAVWPMQRRIYYWVRNR